MPTRLLEMMSVRGRVDVCCSYGAPWRIEQRPRELNEIPSHAVLAGSAILENPIAGRPLHLRPGDILLTDVNSEKARGGYRFTQT